VIVIIVSIASGYRAGHCRVDRGGDLCTCGRSRLPVCAALSVDWEAFDAQPLVIADARSVVVVMVVELANAIAANSRARTSVQFDRLSSISYFGV
jgi:hypothetical protein